MNLIVKNVSSASTVAVLGSVLAARERAGHESHTSKKSAVLYLMSTILLTSLASYQTGVTLPRAPG